MCFALSILAALEKNLKARALILAPNREMAQQIYKVFIDLCKDLPITSCLAIGGIPAAKKTSQLKKNPLFIVATPSKVYYILGKNASDKLPMQTGTSAA